MGVKRERETPKPESSTGRFQCFLDEVVGPGKIEKETGILVYSLKSGLIIKTYTGLREGLEFAWVTFQDEGEEEVVGFYPVRVNKQGVVVLGIRPLPILDVEGEFKRNWEKAPTQTVEIMKIKEDEGD